MTQANPSPRKTLSRQTLVRVTLARVHTHRGQELPVGSVISVHPAVAEWLRSAGALSPKSTPVKKD